MSVKIMGAVRDCDLPQTIDDCRTERYQRLQQAVNTPAEDRTPADVQIINEYGGWIISEREAEIMLQMAKVTRMVDELERLAYGR